MQHISQSNQWRNTAKVLDWFERIPQKEKCKFIQLDIVEFYPSITADLLEKALDFARSITAIDADTHGIIMHSRKSLLFNSDTIWVKRSNPQFDVTMGAYDGAEVCEIVGLYLLSMIKEKCKDIDLGLYRDDGLGITRNLSGPQTERLRKDITQIFKDAGLKITIECGLQQVNFLDATLSLPNRKYWPFRKPNDTPLYIHTGSNHPLTIIKELPLIIEKRISSISCDETEFLKAKDEYASALKSSGFNHDLKFSKPPVTTRRRQRNII